MEYIVARVVRLIVMLVYTFANNLVMLIILMITYDVHSLEPLFLLPVYDFSTSHLMQLLFWISFAGSPRKIEIFTADKSFDVDITSSLSKDLLIFLFLKLLP